MHSEKAKDSPRSTAGELQNSLVSGSENLGKWPNSPYITTCCPGVFQEKFSSLIQKQTPAYSVIRHDWNFKWDWLLSSDETKKMSFLAANTQGAFGEHRDNKYPMCTMKYTAVFLILLAYISAGGQKMSWVMSWTYFFLSLIRSTINR